MCYAKYGEKILRTCLIVQKIKTHKETKTNHHTQPYTLMLSHTQKHTHTHSHSYTQTPIHTHTQHIYGTNMLLHDPFMSACFVQIICNLLSSIQINIKQTIKKPKFARNHKPHS